MQSLSLCLLLFLLVGSTLVERYRKLSQTHFDGSSVIFPKWPHLDGKRRGTCVTLCPSECLIEIFSPNYRDAADVLLAFCERTIGDQSLSTFHSNDGRGGCFM